MVRSEDLTGAQREALDAIVLGKLAWSPAAEIEASGHAHEVLEELVQLELAVWWTLAGSLQITLTPYGAAVMRVHIIERLSIIGEELEEDPYWIDIIREASSLVLPKRRHEIRWPWMDELPDPDAVDPVHGPEFLVDEVSGKEIELFTQLFDGTKVSGVKIKIDPRLKGAKGKQATPKATKQRKAG